VLAGESEMNFLAALVKVADATQMESGEERNVRHFRPKHVLLVPLCVRKWYTNFMYACSV